MADKPKHASERDFSVPEDVGPMRVAAFVGGAKDEVAADVVGFIGQLLASVRRSQ